LYVMFHVLELPAAGLSTLLTAALGPLPSWLAAWNSGSALAGSAYIAAASKDDSVEPLKAANSGGLHGSRPSASRGERQQGGPHIIAEPQSCDWQHLSAAVTAVACKAVYQLAASEVSVEQPLLAYLWPAGLHAVMVLSSTQQAVSLGKLQ
jgi:hypothetical protein